MKPKTIVSAALILFVVASLAYMIIGGGSPEAAPDNRDANTPADTAAAEAGLENGVQVFYFHTSQRCPTCRNIETHSRAVVDESFARELESGAIVWRAVNVEDPANRHFIEDFDLANPGVVLAEMRDGAATRFRALNDVWTHARQPDRLKGYVKDEIQAFLGEE